MFPKRFLALTLFAALAVMPSCVLHAQWVLTNGFYYITLRSINLPEQVPSISFERFGYFLQGFYLHVFLP
jgi:hypothetical protein